MLAVPSINSLSLYWISQKLSSRLTVCASTGVILLVGDAIIKIRLDSSSTALLWLSELVGDRNTIHLTSMGCVSLLLPEDAA